jgi:hypothetical protein
LLQLALGAGFGDFLGKIVSERVIHYVQEVSDRMVEDDVNYVLICLFNLLLQEAAAALVFGKEVRVLQKASQFLLIQPLVAL